MGDRVALISKNRTQRTFLAIALGSAIGVGLVGAEIPQAAYAAPEPGDARLSADTVSTIQAQIAASIGNVGTQGLSRPALDAALSAAIAHDVETDVSTFGADSAGEIASIVISTAGAPAADIGAGLGEAAAQIAKTDFKAAARIARAVAAEGAPGEAGAFANAANLAGDANLAEIVGGAPALEVTTPGVGITFGGSAATPPPPAPPPCANPSCS